MLTWVEEDDGFETGELGVVDLYVGERLDELIHDTATHAGDVYVRCQCALCQSKTKL